MCDGQARTLAFVLTGGQVADTSMFTDVLDEIHVAGRGSARTRPERVLADKGYPSKKNRAWLRERGIKATIPERDDQIAHRRKRAGRPIDFGHEQKERYKGRNVIEPPSPSSSSGEDSHPDTTRPPTRTQPGSASQPPFNGFSHDHI
ncbi:hypothetical protein GCM10010461_23480 [Microbacterium aurantiacum]